MATMYVNFGSFNEWSIKISNDNDKLLEYLNDIAREVNSLESTYQSNASEKIREKINGMKPRFEKYYQVVDSYARFVKNSGESFKAIEQVNTNQASQFI